MRATASNMDSPVKPELNKPLPAVPTPRRRKKATSTIDISLDNNRGCGLKDTSSDELSLYTKKTPLTVSAPSKLARQYPLFASHDQLPEASQHISQNTDIGMPKKGSSLTELPEAKPVKKTQIIAFGQSPESPTGVAKFMSARKRFVTGQAAEEVEWNESRSPTPSSDSSSDYGDEEVFNPLDEAALAQLPLRLQQNMRELHKERMERRDRMIAEGRLRMPQTTTETVGESENDQGSLPGRQFESLHPEDSRSMTSGVSPPGVLRVVNGSNRSSSNDQETTQEGHFRGGESQAMMDGMGSLRSTGSISSMSSSSDSEEIVPMAHWQSEARRIGIPGSSPVSNPIPIPERKLQGQKGGSTAAEDFAQIHHNEVLIPMDGKSHVLPGDVSFGERMRRPFRKLDSLGRLFRRNRSMSDDEQNAGSPSLRSRRGSHAELGRTTRTPALGENTISDMPDIKLRSSARSTSPRKSARERGPMDSDQAEDTREIPGRTRAVTLEGLNISDTSPRKKSPKKAASNKKSMTFRGQVEKYI